MMAPDPAAGEATGMGPSSTVLPLTREPVRVLTDIQPLAVNAPTAPSRAQLFLARQKQIEAEFANVKEAGLLYAGVLLPCLFATGWAYHAGSVEVTTVDVVASVVFCGTIAGFAWRWWPDLAPLLTRPRAIDRTATVVLLLAPLVSLTGVLVQEALLGPYLAMSSLTEPFLSAGWPGWSMYLWIAVLPAVFEEIAFRGLLLTKLSRVMRPAHAVWVTAILFGVIHFAFLSLAFFLVPIALMAGWLTQRTRSLWPAVAVHFVHNAAVVTFELLG